MEQATCSTKPSISSRNLHNETIVQGLTSSRPGVGDVLRRDQPGSPQIQSLDDRGDDPSILRGCGKTRRPDCVLSEQTRRLMRLGTSGRPLVDRIVYTVPTRISGSTQS